MCWSVCVWSIFSNRYTSYSFSLILTKLDTHDLCANMQKKTVEQIFKNFDFIIFGDFFEF